jgi:cell wall-associated NlpC family hydrolase
MSATICRSFSRALIVLAMVLAALVTSSSLFSPSAQAMTQQARERVVNVAASKEGAPYRYGANGPWRFDCSGYTQWVFGRLGRHLPRTSSQQYGAVRHIRRADRQRGDLVFFMSGGHVYHVAIYAGLGRVWHAPRSGERVHRERIWTSSVAYGRVR